MHPIVIVLTVALFTTANFLTAYLYLYPIVHGCAFPKQPSQLSDGGSNAPFRLLVFGDPQLEGSSSIINEEYKFFPSLRDFWEDFQSPSPLSETLASSATHLFHLVFRDIPVVLKVGRKRLDLFGNDFYLAHIYRSLHWLTHPTHVTVVGDLLGSQWISDSEFEERGRRYWDRVFSGGQKVDDEVTGQLQTTVLGQDTDWADRIINVAGNHDIGYAGDITKDRIARFERMFGKVNWETRFTLPTKDRKESGDPELRVVVLNSLNIDNPVEDPDSQTETFAFLDHLIDTRPPINETSSATILLTHLPLHKEAGICVDAPLVNYYSVEAGGGIEEQNHLTNDASEGLLNTIYGMGKDPADDDAVPGSLGRHGIVLTGHDHEGCDVYHYLQKHDADVNTHWKAEGWTSESPSRHSDVSGIREITLRSMMGEFGGNAGLLSAWYDRDHSKWEFEFTTCPLGEQHFWWAVHVLDIITLFVCGLAAIHVAAGKIRGSSRESRSKQKTQ